MILKSGAKEAVKWYKLLFYRSLVLLKDSRLI
jgi:hypothetical protein